ncbi:DUF4386 domain-containing protein [Altibacter sp. HG106]|uniref:DUF4386 domain-containing protein n=1 Tax=Altibacter sp. HG106 TaxID=3023937 RepID=UPI002350099B|nr:DUF4386 domain-containing protein [Altibacter sp. HG106]MDC7995643.1 DUF4386 domain-containing protein [Altibacter sp. HG106]
MTSRHFARIAGVSYLIIFFSAIFANFFVVEKLIATPSLAFAENTVLIRFGIVAFLVTVLLDIVIAWALQQLYAHHALSLLSTFLRVSHALLMGIALYPLAEIVYLDTEVAVLNNLRAFNTMWLIGLFLFGFHLILLARIIPAPKILRVLIAMAGLLYILDTSAYFLLASYEQYASLLLLAVATFSILGEMTLTLWLLTKGGKINNS